MDLREYLRDEIIEEAELGYMSPADLKLRLAFFDSGGTLPVGDAAMAKATEHGPASPLSVPEGDASIHGEDRSIDTPVGPLDIYVVRPKGRGKLPAVLLIHDRLGLVEHTRDVARRLATLGYVVVAPDLLTPAGGARTFADDDGRIAALGTLDQKLMVTQLLAAFDEMAKLDDVDPDRLGCLGFCFGGAMTWLVAVHEPRLVAAVSFYGRIPPLELVPNIRAAVLGIYGSLDEHITEGAAKIALAMATAGKSFDQEIYEGAQHAFHNDTHPDRYHPEAAARSWVRATTFLDAHLAN